MNLSGKPLNVFIGYDSKHPTVSEVCAYSLSRRSSIPVIIHFLKLNDLIASGVYSRPFDPLASTEFTYSRFLTPYLSGYEGIALFCDNDFLWMDDIAKLLSSANENYPLSCVQQIHSPPEKIKMEGQVQTLYPRKNWSSLMLFNCNHRLNRKLDLDMVNNQSGSYLHQMQWLPEDMIGSLEKRWNWLEGSCPAVNVNKLGAIHFTRGGPWLEQWQHIDFASYWNKENQKYLINNRVNETDMSY